MTTAVGIDLGGTNCRFGVVADDGAILHQETVPVGNDRDPQAVVKFLVENVDKMRHNPPTPPLEKGGKGGFEIHAIGLGAPGIVDFERGVILRSPHYPDWHNFPLRDELSKACGLPVVLDNDANIIAAGEAWLGAGKGLKNFIMITLGTGIGGGLIINGEVFHGDSGFAGEIGHQVILFDGQRCDCGGRGCWETIVSASGLNSLIVNSDDPRKEKFLEQFHGEVDKVTPKKLYELAREGDLFANLIWKKFGAYLGVGIASLVNVTGIFNIVIGGGISNAWDFFISEAKREIAKRTYKETAGRIVLKRAELGEVAGVLGAARVVIGKFPLP